MCVISAARGQNNEHRRSSLMTLWGSTGNIAFTCPGNASPAKLFLHLGVKILKFLGKCLSQNLQLSNCFSVSVPLYLENFQHSHRTIWLYAGRLHCSHCCLCIMRPTWTPPPHTHTVPPRAATFTHAWENTHTSPRTTVNHLQGANKKLRPLERGQECVQSQWKNKLGRERGGRRVRWSNHCPLPTQEEDMQYREHYEEVSSVLIGPLIFLFCPTVPYDLSFLIFVHRMNEPNRLWEETYLLVFLCIINNLQEIHDLVFKQ